jgi:hypothetical protein
MSRERDAVHAWALARWKEPVQVVWFNRKRFDLNLPSRKNVGTHSRSRRVFGLIFWIAGLPLFFAFAVLMSFLEPLNFEFHWPTRVGTLSVSGMKLYGPAVDFVDLMVKAPRSAWVVFSASRIAFVKAGFGETVPEPFWHSEPGTVVECVPGNEGGALRICWPDQGEEPPPGNAEAELRLYGPDYEPEPPSDEDIPPLYGYAALKLADEETGVVRNFALAHGLGRPR